MNQMEEALLKGGVINEVDVERLKRQKRIQKENKRKAKARATAKRVTRDKQLAADLREDLLGIIRPIIRRKFEEAMGTPRDEAEKTLLDTFVESASEVALAQFIVRESQRDRLVGEMRSVLEGQILSSAMGEDLDAIASNVGMPGVAEEPRCNPSGNYPHCQCVGCQERRSEERNEDQT